MPGHHDPHGGETPVTATFLFADLAGYTALTEAHGDVSAADEAATFCDGVRGLLGDYGADEVNALGDALLVRVPDAGNAVHLGARIAGDFGRRDRALGVRVGMHTGTAVMRGTGWFGSAINVAARIADLAKRGEVLMSAATRDAASDSIAVARLEARGLRELRNVPRPVEIFALVAGDDAVLELPTDPVCRMVIDPALGAITRTHRGTEFHFCSEQCASAFDELPTRYTERPAD